MRVRVSTSSGATHALPMRRVLRGLLGTMTARAMRTVVMIRSAAKGAPEDAPPALSGMTAIVQVTNGSAASTPRRIASGRLSRRA